MILFVEVFVFSCYHLSSWFSISQTICGFILWFMCNTSTEPLLYSSVSFLLVAICVTIWLITGHISSSGC
jgi:hypothetical protein